jgi:hypothetical protein
MLPQGKTFKDGFLVLKNPDFAGIVGIYIENTRCPGSRSSITNPSPYEARRIRINVNLEGTNLPMTVNKNSYIHIETDGYFNKELFRSKLREIIRELGGAITARNALLFDQRIDKQSIDKIRGKRATEAGSRLKIFNSLKEGFKTLPVVKIISEKEGFGFGLELINGVRVALDIDGTEAEISYINIPSGAVNEENKQEFLVLLDQLSYILVRRPGE